MDVADLPLLDFLFSALLGLTNVLLFLSRLLFVGISSGAVLLCKLRAICIDLSLSLRPGVFVIFRGSSSISESLIIS